MSKKAITVLSGGADSTTLAYLLAAQGYDQHFISFNYGQRHHRELECASITAKKLNGSHSILKLPLGDLLKGSSLTDNSVAIPHGHYEEVSMAQTVVPGRNAIMLSIAWGISTAECADLVACGVHAGDRAIYADCRPEFIKALAKALMIGTETKELLEYPYQRLWAPFILDSKAEIVRTGLELKVPYSDTYTCYEGKEVACGLCGTCVERLSSFEEAGAEDPIEYKDRITWKKIVKDFQARP